MATSPIPDTVTASAAVSIVTPAPKTPKKLTLSSLKKPPRKRFPINDHNIQLAAIEKCLDFMGMDFWTYIVGYGKRYRWRAQLLEEVRNYCGFSLSYKTLMRWIAYYHKYGEVPAKSRRHRPTIKGMRMSGNKAFTTRHTVELKRIVDSQPQLYLDELQKALFHSTGRLFSNSTIWRHLRSIKYSLKNAVFRAKQQKEEEVNAYHRRINDRLYHPKQALFIDESAKDQNASRRSRAYAPLGVTPVISSAFVRDFDKRYTLLGACNWEGFVKSACHLVEREHGSDDTDPTRGTVDAERFEQYLQQHVAPILGNAALREPNSIVIMDNASIHDSTRVREIIEGAGALLVYTAPYSPELNPIEYMFGEYKKALRRNSHDGTKDWFHVHWLGLDSVSPSMAKQFFSHCKVPKMDQWLEEHARRDTGILPKPLNTIFSGLLDLTKIR